jgi:hypothetical protein
MEIQNKELKKVMNQLGIELVKGLVKELIAADKKVTGNLVRSIDYKLIEVADNLILELLSADYLDQVDQGRKPGKQPPTRALDKWIVRRGIAPRSKNGKFIPRESVKFLIARSIGKNGIKGIFVVKKTIEEIYSNKTELIKKAALKDLNELIDKIIV